MLQLRAIVIIGASEESLTALEAELLEPNYSDYRIVFTNHVDRTRLDALVKQDRHHAVVSVMETFADFYAASMNLFSLNMFGTSVLHDEQRWDQRIFSRICDGLCASLLAFRCRPVVRFSARSPVTQRVADEMEVLPFMLLFMIMMILVAPHAASEERVFLVPARSGQSVTDSRQTR